MNRYPTSNSVVSWSTPPPPSPRLACDVSNYTGELKQETIDQLKGWGVDHIMMGTQDVLIAQQQLAIATENGLYCDIYLQFNANAGAEDQIIRACYARANTAVDRLWITVEQIAQPWAGTPAQYRTQLEQLWKLLPAFGLFDRGIYTSASQWITLMENTQDFSDYHLWYANYDNPWQQLDAQVWHKQGFGGWWKPRWRQYQQNYDINGQVVDFSIGPS